MSEEPIIIIYPASPDRLEKAVRLVCGALFGLLPPFFLWLIYGPFNLVVTWSLVLVSIVSCATCALSYGNSFWQVALGAFRGLR